MKIRASLGPQRCNHLRQKEFTPARRGLIDDAFLQAGILAADTGWRQLLVITAPLRHFAKTDMGKQFMRTVGSSAFAARRISNKFRIDNGNLKCLQIG